MADLATIQLSGRLTHDPETTETQKSAVVKFAMANNGFKEGSVSYFDCEAWGKVGEIVQKHCQKGKQILVEGTIRIDRWQDKDGNNRSKPVVNVRGVTFVGSKSDSNEAPKPQQPQQQAEAQDDIPF